MCARLRGGLLLLFLLTPSSASAWGFAGHQFIMRRAIDLLPAEIKPFFEHYRTEMTLRVIDPDLWRNVGWEDDPNHFLDFGVPEFGKFPFTGLPREYGAAIEKFGMATLNRYGKLPWREAEEFGNLRRAFESFAKEGLYAPSDTVLFSAVASHYIQDACQPFHATINYDGQLTGNHGIHARFERDLIERYESRLTVTPGPVTPITNARDAAFDVLLAGYQLVDSILDADREAARSKEIYDDGYFENFFTKVRPILEKQLTVSIHATAGIIVGAWQQAGRPQLKLQGARPPQRVRPKQP